ncbi:hypothetical protein GCM10009593_16410 [Microlunatus antarcticus]
MRERRGRRNIRDLRELLRSTFPSPVVALDREWGDDCVDLLSDVDLLEDHLTAALSWGREPHRPALVVALEQAVSCHTRWDPLMTEGQRDALKRVVDALRVLVMPEGDLSVWWATLHGLTAVATEGEYAGCTVTIEVRGSGVVLFAIEGTPIAGGEAVSWEASATDDQGVQEWLASFGLRSAAAGRLEPNL